MGNCPKSCCDSTQISYCEIENKNNLEDYFEKRFSNITKTKSEQISEQLVNPSSNQNLVDHKKVIYFENGCIYEGDWDDVNQRHGYGKYTWNDGSEYIGNWAYNRAQGYGKLTYVGGDVFEGNWENDKANGYGEYRQRNGIVYKGNWLNDKQHGKGFETLSSTANYQGDYVDGKKQGFGRLNFDDKAFYEVN